MICKYCGKECKNKNSLVQHEIRCKQNPNRIEYSGYAAMKFNQIGHKGHNQYTKAKELGLSKPIISEETKLKLSIKTKEHNKIYWSNPENKIKQSVSMRKAASEYPESYCSSNVNGRVKRIKYNDIWLDSSWEVEVAKALDENNIIWNRPNKGFEYEWNESKHIYYPDFYLPDYDIYIEVKGFERERDRIKYKILDNLIVIRKDEIELLKLNKEEIFKILAQGSGFHIPS